MSADKRRARGPAPQKRSRNTSRRRRARRRTRKLDREQLGTDLYTTARRIEAVECMAVCVEHALLERKSDSDRELAICVERFIADELRSVCRAMAAMMTALGEEPYIHLLESPVLGLRFEPIMDTMAREGRPRP
jgi:hypothetical protein